MGRHGGRFRPGRQLGRTSGNPTWPEDRDLMATTDTLPAPQDEAPLEVIRIRPSRGWRAIDLRELWRYRELLWFLTLRDVKLRYKQTVLGVAWAVIQPLFTMGVFTVFFGNLGKLPSDGKPYALFVLAALIPWQLFAYALTQSSNSLVTEQRLITKVYFPRLIVPVASVLSGLVDFLVAFALLLVTMAVGPLLGWGRVAPTWAMLTLPAFVLFAVLTAMAVGLWLSALNVRYRDVRYTIPFLTQFWMFLTPVAYPASLVPPAYRPLYGLNPMAGVVEGFRWALLGTDAPDWGLMAVSVGVVVALLVGGVLYFRRMEKTFADVV
jgi:lipopolysaccharide transport system permease protein